MANRILLCGMNGAGKSTLGKALAKELDWKFLDIEDYWFPKESADYPFAGARTKEEVCAMLFQDLQQNENCILAAVKGNYGNEVTALFTHAVLLHVPKAERLQRIRARSYQKFGERMLPGGDLYRQEEAFFAMAESRSEAEAADWLSTLSVPVTVLDGTVSIEENIMTLKALLTAQ